MHILQTVLADVNGATFIGIDSTTVVKLTGGKKNIMQGRVTKTVTGSNVMVFTNKNSNGYSNMVARRLEKEGKDPGDFKLSPRPWGVRIPDSPFVQHNDKLYLEVIFLKAGTVEYLFDGRSIDKDQIEGLADKEEGEQGGLDNKVVIRTYSVDNITAITVDKQRHIF